MIAIFIVLRSIVSALIIALVGISFFPKEGATALTRLQKVLTRQIERRRK